METEAAGRCTREAAAGGGAEEALAAAAGGQRMAGGGAAAGGGGETAAGERRKRKNSSSSIRAAAGRGKASSSLSRTAAAADAAAAATAETAAAAEAGSDADVWVYEDDFGDDFEEEELEVCMRQATASSSSSEEEDEERSEKEEEEEKEEEVETSTVREDAGAAAAERAAAAEEEKAATAAAAGEQCEAAEAATRGEKKGKVKKKKKKSLRTSAAAPEDADLQCDPTRGGRDGERSRREGKRLWRPGVDALAEGEELQCDMSAYHVLHRMTLDWPCLSFDILPNEENQRATRSSRPPFHCYVVSGTQAEKSSQNRIFAMKWTNLQRTSKDGRDSSSSEDEEEEENSTSEDEEEEESVNDEDARLDFRLVAHRGTINRIRSCPQMKRLIATWSETGDVEVWDMAQQLERLDDPGAAGPPPSPHQRPKFTHRSRSGAEGFAIDWNPVHTGRLLTGDTRGAVHLWLPVEAGWSVSCVAEAARSSSSNSSRRKKKSNKSNTNSSNTSVNGSSSSNMSSSNSDVSSSSSNASSSSSNMSNSSSSNLRFAGVSEGATVEEVQWKVTGDGAGEVFATASSDGAIRIYDCREGGTEEAALQLLHAHPCDVNALRWSPLHGDLLLSGDEEGCVKVWDKRYGETPLALMRWHKKAITSVDWHPTDEAVFASAALDDAVAFWDLSIEAEDAHFLTSAAGADGVESSGEQQLPDQLLFVHMGQEHISEVKFHPQIPGAVISTACDGFNFFKPCNL